MAFPPSLLTAMNALKLIEDLELIVDIQYLRKIGLTDEEIEGFFEFEWDDGIGVVELLPRFDANDKN